jgi:hypothetical protein
VPFFWHIRSWTSLQTNSEVECEADILPGYLAEGSSCEFNMPYIKDNVVLIPIRMIGDLMGKKVINDRLMRIRDYHKKEAAPNTIGMASLHDVL